MTTSTSPSLLGIYLNDHLAGATVGRNRARQTAASAEPGTEAAVILTRFADQVDADRSALLKLMKALGVPVRGYKVFAAWAGERAGRLKLNGRLVSRSPLSDLEEVEILRLGVVGKAAGWRTLRLLAEQDKRLDPAELDRLIARADQQEETLEGLRATMALRLITADAG